MSGDAPVDPAEVPVFTGDLPLLDEKVTAISGAGPKISTAASDIHTSFGGLRAFYQAPEAEQLFAVTKPVSDTGLSLSSDLCVIAGALGTYSRDAAPLAARLDSLRGDAVAFRSKVADDDKWREDGDLIEENLNRRNEIAEVWTAFQEVERAAYAKIVALVGGTPLKVNDGSNQPGMYGYDAEALKQSKSLPWGDAVAESVPWWQVWEHAYDFGKGVIIDGVWGTIKGLGTLVGFSGWDAAGQAWVGLGKLATGVLITAVPVVGAAYWAMPADKLPSWLRDSRTAMKETGKALLAWDQWSENPSRAAGAVTFNVVTTIFTGGTAGAAAGAGKAGAAAKVLSLTGKASRAIDPMTYIFKGAGAGLSKIGDVMAGLKGMGNITIPAFPEGTIVLPEGAIKSPDGTINLPEGATVPEGAVELPDGTVKLPEGTTALPPGTVRLPGEGAPRFLDPEGNILKEDGSVLQRGDEARVENTPNPTAGADNPLTQVPARQEQPVLAGVGARTGDDVVRVGSNISDPIRVGDNASGRAGDTAPGGAANHLPGGTAGNNMPTNNLDNTPGGRSGGDTPGGGNLGDHTPTGRTETPPTTPAIGHDLPGGSATDNGLPSSAHPATPGAGGLDDAARGADDVSRAGDDAAPPQRGPVPRPSFMREGENPYGPRGSLTREQIEDIQVYRANEEPGYFEDHYRKDGTRKNLEIHDQSGYTPPQLTRLSDDTPWIRAKDAPAPPKPHFLDDDYIGVGADTVTSATRLRILEEAAQTRHFAIQWDNLVADWKAQTGAAHQAQGTLESAGLWAEARGTYKESHTEMGKAAEAFGENVAEHHFVAERYPDFDKETLLGPKNGNDQFDQVWKHEDGRVVVIEAKSSPGTELGRRTLPDARQVSQGSREYFLDIIRAMRKRGEIELARDLRKALDEGKLEYVVVKGEKNAGT
ncbi:hypothetical protein ACFRMN_27265 [Streptomyces sp. NPDC056835]|uniref:hypothetical protein n=1 Tax=Streptomyces sp. NPDC056835 TaxID=3345956 RepID=UPI0036A387B9